MGQFFLKLGPGREKITPGLQEKLAILAKNNELTDRHRGQRCFILGAGSFYKEVRTLRSSRVRLS